MNSINHFIRLPVARDFGLQESWRNFFNFISHRYRPFMERGNASPRIDCLRIQTDVIILVYYILVFRSFELGIRNYMEQLGIEEIVYVPYDKAQQYNVAAVQELLGLINDVVNRVLDARQSIIENYNFEPQIQEYTYRIKGYLFHGIGDELFINLSNISGIFLEDHGPNLLIPLFFEILDPEIETETGVDVEQSVIDFESGDRYLTNYITDSHAFTMFIDETGHPFIFDPHFNNELIELHNYNPIPESKFLMYTYKNPQAFVGGTYKPKCMRKNNNKVKRKKSKRKKSKRKKSKRKTNRKKY